MVYVAVRHMVGNFQQWKEGFDTHLAARQASHATGEVVVMRNVNDPNDLTVILGWRDLHHAKAFMRSVSWQMALQEMGVVGVPEVVFLKRVR